MLIILCIVANIVHLNLQDVFGQLGQSTSKGDLNIMTNASSALSQQEEFSRPIVIDRMTDLFGQSSPSSFPQISQGMNNLTYVLFAKPAEDGDLNKLIFLRSTDGGKSFEPARNVTSDNADLPSLETLSSSGGYVPRLASANDTVYIAFVNHTRSFMQGMLPDELNFVKSIDGGASFASPVNLKIEDIRFIDDDEASLVTGSNNTIFMFLVARGAETPEDSLILKKSIDGGASFEKAVSLDKNMTMSAQGAVSGNNVYVASGDGCGSILFKRSTDRGESFQTTKIIYPADGGRVCVNPSDVRLSALGSNIYLTWGSEGDILFQRSTDGGESFERSIKLTNTSTLFNRFIGSTSPTVTALNNGGVCVAWENTQLQGEFQTTGTDIFLKCSSDNGSSFGDAINLSNNTSFQDPSEGILFSTVRSKHPDMSTDGDNLLVVWENSAGSVRQIMFTRSVSK